MTLQDSVMIIESTSNDVQVSKMSKYCYVNVPDRF